MLMGRYIVEAILDDDGIEIDQTLPYICWPYPYAIYAYREFLYKILFALISRPFAAIVVLYDFDCR